MASDGARRGGFRPKADAIVLAARPGPLPEYPNQVEPIFDAAGYQQPLSHWSADAQQFYPSCVDPHAPALVPEKPPAPAVDRYLRAYLSSNERLRLSMLWYYTHDIFKEKEFLLGLQEKVALAQESTNWEYVVIGILDLNVYIRLATVGLPLQILPRGETLCAHTVTQPPGSVFLLPNMMEDWRFRQSPYVEQGGLTAYAGVPLRLQSEPAPTVALGSLCVASSTAKEPLNKVQQSTLARLADWVVSDLIQCTRARRQRIRREMSDLLVKAQKQVDATDSETPVYEILSTIYPDAAVSLQSYRGGDLEVDGIDAIAAEDIEDGIWEDIDFLDDFIATSNHRNLPDDRIVRLLTAHCESASGPSLLMVASKNYRHVFDDIDSWFLQSCATMLSATWQRRLLTEAMKAKERFLRGFSHQLRTPLHVILSSAELLAEEMKTQSLRELTKTTPALLQLAQAVDSKRPTMYLDTIKTAGRDLISIVNNMITLNRWADIAAQERQYAIHTTHELEAELATEIAKVLSLDVRAQSHVFFHHNITPSSDSLRIDLGLVRDSVLPVIVNAIQCTPDGTVAVTIKACPNTKELIIDVEDNGCGIDPEDHDRIFEPYERAKENEAVGAGLGLSLASRFATLLQGSVKLITSQPGHGAHFRVSYKGVEFMPSDTAWTPLASKLTSLPTTFYCPGKAEDLSLTGQFCRFLGEEGYERATDPAGSFTVLEYQTDLEKNDTQLGRLSLDQVAICLVPAAQADASITTSTGHVVYAAPPFFTSKLRSTIEEADRAASALRPAANTSASPDPESAIPQATTREQKAQSPPVVEPVAAILELITNKQQSDVPEPSTEPSPEDSFSSLEKHVEECTRSSVQLSQPTKPVALLVDDNAVNLRILQMYCNKRKLEYYSAVDGEQAVEIFKQRQELYEAGQGNAISLIFMDLQMPVCDGIEATRQIRQLEAERDWPRSSLFIVTGQDGSADRTAAREAGSDDYFVKPVSIKILDTGVKKHFPQFQAAS